MARCAHLVIFYFKEKFCVSHASASSLVRCLLSEAANQTLWKKLYLQLYLTQIIRSNGKVRCFGTWLASQL